MNRERLLNVARALRESQDPEKFAMTSYAHHCGTPACALGHYAFRADLQDEFKLRRYVELKTPRPDYDIDDYGAINVDYWDEEILEHFGVDERQAEALFSSIGCGRARTALEAAEFIEAFVASGGEVRDSDEEDWA